jgi:predicted nucleic acid-binding protein
LSLYLDTSVLVPYYAPERLSEACEQLIVSQQDRPAISDLCEVELASALARKLRLGEIERRDVDRMRALFRSHVEGFSYTRLPLERKHYRLAEAKLNRINSPLRTLDALHLACASLARLPLATADVALARSAEEAGIEVILVAG